jgi:hypothetical protein
MARKFLAIPATSTCVERLFSHSGKFFTSARPNLKAETAKICILLHYCLNLDCNLDELLAAAEEAQQDPGQYVVSTQFYLNSHFILTYQDHCSSHFVSLFFRTPACSSFSPIIFFHTPISRFFIITLIFLNKNIMLFYVNLSFIL